MRVAWTLTDNSSGAAVVLPFEWNPNEFSPPGRDSSISGETTTAPNGQMIYFQGRDKMRTASLKGAVGTQVFYEALDTWKDKHYPLVLTDDEGRSWNIIFQTWTWTRVSRRNRWRYDYTAQVIVI